MTRLNVTRIFALALSLAFVGGPLRSDAQAEKSRPTSKKGVAIEGLIELGLIVEDDVVFVEGLPGDVLYVKAGAKAMIRLHGDGMSHEGIIIADLMDGSTEIWEPYAGENFVDYDLTGLTAPLRLQFAAVPLEAEGTEGTTESAIKYGPVITVKPKG